MARARRRRIVRHMGRCIRAVHCVWGGEALGGERDGASGMYKPPHCYAPLRALYGPDKFIGAVLI